MPPDWDALLTAYLHDPPGKALDIRGHESDASRLLSIALLREVSRQQLHADTRTEDTLASRLERIVPLPSPGEKYERAVSPENGQLHIRHPLSGAARTLAVGALDPTEQERTLRELVVGLDPPRARALAVWRCWREQLTRTHVDWGLLPADTRLPDHTVWNHNDAAMGIAGAKDQQGVVLLTFSLGPVQPFIAAARTVRDLWTGSYLLAWLTFAAMKPILEAYGPASILMPALRGNPLLDHWLRTLRFDESPDAPCWLQGHIARPSTEQLLSPCLPNRFTAVVPLGRESEKAAQVARRCEESCREEWERIARSVHDRFGSLLRREHIPHASSWDRLWDAQVHSFFEMRTATLPLNDCSDETLVRLLGESEQVRHVQGLADVIPPADRLNYPRQSSGQWMGAMDLLGRLLAARRTLRPLPDYDPPADSQGNYPAKCSLLGTYEQLGPAERTQADAFWAEAVEQARCEGARLGQRERLCAVSLIKRFAWSTYLAGELECSISDLKYPDTATVAATVWLQSNGIDPNDHPDWSGQWLHWAQQSPKDADEATPSDTLWKQIRQARGKEAPPAYYAILMLDGDRMGQWLRGEKSPTVRQALAPKLGDYFANLPRAESGLNARRPFGPAMYAAISEALTNFALHCVPRIIGKHQGTLIYAGGDDVLALLPTRTALDCACALNAAYCQDWDAQTGRLLMGSSATVSAGIAVVHYKEDLRVALQAARDAEKQAKHAGRDALALRVVRRSGEDSSAVIGWPQVPALQALVRDFLHNTSDRWAYRLRSEMPTLDGLGDEPFCAELERLLRHMEQPRREFVERVLSLWKAYCCFCDNQERSSIAARASFVTLCQSASFLARGRDNR